MVADELRSLKEGFGFPASLCSLDWLPVASQTRVYLFDNTCRSKAQFRANCRKVRSAIQSPHANQADFYRWYQRAFCLCIWDSFETINLLSGGVDNIRRERHATPKTIAEDKTWRKVAQKTMDSFLSSKTLRSQLPV